MDLCDINQIKALLNRHGFRFSKSMGQNFLIEDWVPRDIASVSGAGPGTGVLEVGPGIGPLTRELAGRADRVVSVELDRALLPILAETLENCPNAEVISGDILKTDIPTLIGEKFQGLTPIACANLPYNITTPAISALIEAGSFSSITVMIQREVAHRICAAPGTADYGAFSVYCQYHGAAFPGPSGVLYSLPQGDLGGSAAGSPPRPGGGRRPQTLFPGGKGRLRPAAQNPAQQPVGPARAAERGAGSGHRPVRSPPRYPGRAAVYSPICPTVSRPSGPDLSLFTI